MSKTTFSENNIGKPSPLWFRTIRSVMYLCGFPVSLIALQFFSPEAACSKAYVFSVMMIIILTEVAGFFLNDGDEYIRITND
jgi:hypothetical protein